MPDTLITDTTAGLAKAGFDVWEADDATHAARIILDDIVPAVNPTLVSYGDSETLFNTGVLDVFRQSDRFDFIDTFEPGVERADILERRRQALLSDLFFLGANAVTTDGKLVNLDMVGNRVAPMAFGPKKVVVVAGRNKIVPDVNAAVQRIRQVAAPLNAKRHNLRTPCAKTGKCMQCSSPDRICNVWTISERSWPRDRISVIIIDEEHGL